MTVVDDLAGDASHRARGRRVATAVAAGFDVGLRTMTSSVLAAAMAPMAFSRAGVAGDVPELAAYAGLAERSLDELTRPHSPAARPRRLRSRPLPDPWRVGTAEALGFPSDYRPANPGAAEVLATKVRNHTTWAHHWRHTGPPRPTLVVLHGFGASPVAFNRDFFSVPWLYARGINILLVSLPFHGRRRSRALTLNGIELFSSGLTLLNEGLLQAVHDVRRWIDVLEAEGAPAIGVTGLSLGGYVSAAVAAADGRPVACVPNAPVVDITTLLPSWAPAGPLALRVLERHGVTEADLAAALSVHSPLRCAPLVDHEGLMVIAGLGDRLAPPEQSRMLWEHWERPRLHWFSGNHVLHFERRRYTRELADFLDGRGLKMERP